MCAPVRALAGHGGGRAVMRAPRDWAHGGTDGGADVTARRAWGFYFFLLLSGAVGGGIGGGAFGAAAPADGEKRRKEEKK